MAKRRRVLDLSVLESVPPEPLRLPSLDQQLLQGPLEGGWLPEPSGSPVVDRNIWIQVYARIEAEGAANPADLFFGYLKSLLKKAAYVKQDEILVERAHVALLPAIPLPRNTGS